MVMTPEGRGRSAAGITARGPAAPFRTGAAAVRVGHSRQPLGLDVLPAHRAGRVAAGCEAPKRRLDLLQIRPRLTRPLTQLVPALEQSLPYRVGVHESPGEEWASSGGPLAATLVLEP